MIAIIVFPDDDLIDGRLFIENQIFTHTGGNRILAHDKRTHSYGNQDKTDNNEKYYSKISHTRIVTGRRAVVKYVLM